MEFLLFSYKRLCIVPFRIRYTLSHNHGTFVVRISAMLAQDCVSDKTFRFAPQKHSGQNTVIESISSLQ